eukprot:COSAG02_NODE_1035_length_15053_cov_60.180019_9_plen_683_part_00
MAEVEPAGATLPLPGLIALSSKDTTNSGGEAESLLAQQEQTLGAAAVQHGDTGAAGNEPSGGGADYVSLLHQRIEASRTQYDGCGAVSQNLGSQSYACSVQRGGRLIAFVKHSQMDSVNEGLERAGIRVIESGPWDGGADRGKLKQDGPTPVALLPVGHSAMASNTESASNCLAVAADGHDIAFIGDCAGGVTAWNFKNESKLWQTLVADPADKQSPGNIEHIVVTGDLAVCVTQGTGSVVALDMLTGEEQWRQLGFLGNSLDVVESQGLVIAAKKDGSVCALEVATGKERWTSAKVAWKRWEEQDMGWKEQAVGWFGNAGHAIFMVEGETIIAACNPSAGSAVLDKDVTNPLAMMGLDSLTGKRLWTIENPAGTEKQDGVQQVAAGAGMVALISEQSAVRLHDCTTGQLVWQRELRDWKAGLAPRADGEMGEYYGNDVVILGGTVVFIIHSDESDPSITVGLDLVTGQESWSYENPEGGPDLQTLSAIGARTVAQGYYDEGGRIRVFDSETGDMLYFYESYSHDVTHMALDDSSSLLVTATSGKDLDEGFVGTVRTVDLLTGQERWSHNIRVNNYPCGVDAYAPMRWVAGKNLLLLVGLGKEVSTDEKAEGKNLDDGGDDDDNDAWSKRLYGLEASTGKQNWSRKLDAPHLQHLGGLVPFVVAGNLVRIHLRCSSDSLKRE